MNALNNDKKLLVFQSENKTIDNLIIDYYYCFDSDFEPNINLFICSEEETLNLIPIVRCPKFKHEYYNSYDYLYSSIYCNPKLSLFALLFIKYEGVLKFEKIRNQIYDFDQEEKCEYNKSDCHIKNWSWKPTIVKNISESQLKNVYSAIQQGLISSNVNQFWIKKCHFSINFNDSQFTETWEFKNVLKLLDIRERSSVALESIWVDYDKMFDFHIEMVPNSKNIIFSFGGKIYKIHWNGSKATLKGLIYEPNNKSSVIVAKWDYFAADNVVITYEDDVSCFQPDWYDRFPGDDSAPDKLYLYVVLNKSDITSVSYYHIESMKKILTFQNLQKIIIKTVEKDFNKEEFIDALNYIQKPITLRIEWEKDSWFLTNELFWKMLLKFKAAELAYDDSEIIVDWQDQELSQTNILKNKVIIFIDDNEEIIEIGEVINMFKDYYHYIPPDHNYWDRDEEDDIDYYSSY